MASFNSQAPKDEAAEFGNIADRLTKFSGDKLFNLAAARAMKWYVSKESGDVGSQIANGIMAFFYFVALAIKHPVLINKIVSSLSEIGQSKDPDATKKAAMALVKDEKIWSVLIQNETILDNLPEVAKTYFNSQKDIDEQQKSVNDGYLAVLRNLDAVKGALETLRDISIDEKINANILKFLMAKDYTAIINEKTSNIAFKHAKKDYEEKNPGKNFTKKMHLEQVLKNNPQDLPSKELIDVIKSIINMPLEKLDPLMLQLGFIDEKLKLAPEGLVDALTSNSKASIDLVKTAVGMFDGLNAVYKAMGSSWSENLSAMLTAADPLMKSGAIGNLIDQLLAHEKLTNFVASYVGDIIKNMDMSLPGADLSKHMDNIIRFLQNANLWDHIIANDTLREKLIAPLAESYLQRVEDMSFEERKIVYDRLHAKDEVIAADYTQEMFEAEKQAAKEAKESYLAILNNAEVMKEVLSVGKLVMDKNNQDIITYLGKDGKLGNILSIVQTLIDGDKLYPLVDKLEDIFKALAPKNFTQDAPEFADDTYVDKALLGLISTIFDQSKKETTTKFLNAALGKAEGMLAEFANKAVFDAAASVIETLSNDEALKGFVESNPATISKIVRYIPTKMFNDSLKAYNVDDKFWGMLDILFSNLEVTRDLLTGLAAVSNPESYKDMDSTMRAVDKVVHELVKLVEHPVIGRKVQSFIRDNKNVFIALINGVVDSLGVRSSITDYVHGYGLAFDDVLSQLIDDPKGVSNLLEAAKTAKEAKEKWDNASVGGAISGAAQATLNAVSNPGAAAIGAINTGLAATKVAKNVLYAPVVQKVIAELAAPYVPNVVSNIMPSWLKSYIPGVGVDPRGADFADWVQEIIQAKHEDILNLHSTLMNNAKDGAGYEATKSNMLNKLVFNKPQLLLRHYAIDDFNFSLSKATRVFVTGSTLRNTIFDGFEAEQFSGSDSNLYNVSFAGAKIKSISFNKGSVLAKVGFQGVKAEGMRIESSHLSEVDFAGLTFEHEIIRVVEKEVKGWLWGSTVKTEETKVRVKNEDAALTIKDTEMDEVSLNNLVKAARSGGFKIDLQNVKVVNSKEFEVDNLENQLEWCKIKAATKNGVVTMGFNVENQMYFSNPDHPLEIQKGLMSQKNIKMFLKDHPEEFAEILKKACDFRTRKSDVEGIIKDIQSAINSFMKDKKGHAEALINERRAGEVEVHR
ncbi:MAG: hypothetical protein K0R73_206 [Candidatus Midichloriaceae bacterium]|jgi:hypothetical protein|nr:hypothetical protein [Candidatus Midichloriaceae bacterium]